MVAKVWYEQKRSQRHMFYSLMIVDWCRGGLLSSLPLADWNTRKACCESLDDSRSHPIKRVNQNL